MLVLFWITVAVGAIWVPVFLSGCWQLRQTPRVQPEAPGGLTPLPSVDVYIPARNEADHIDACLQSLLNQRGVELRIVVIDDNSRDDTAARVRAVAARDKRVVLVQVGEPPPGRMGKVHALVQGQGQCPPQAEWLLFTDADTVYQPEGLAACLHLALERQVDLISLVPTLVGESFWERLVQPAVAALIALFHRPSRVNDPDSRDVFANGQFMLVKALSYQRVGSHQAVASRVLEDVELARLFKRNGATILLADGRRVFATRMYVGLSQIVAGWSKNLILLFKDGVGQAWLAAVVAVCLSAWPAVFGWWSLGCLLSGATPWPAWQLWLMVIIYLVSLGFQAVLRAFNRWYPVYALFSPIGNLVVVFILSRSGWLQLTGRGAIWKDRRVIDRP